MFEMLVGLELSDTEVYSQYREAMKPILANYGGNFGYDFVVSEVLKSKVDVPINRVFTINFPDQESADKFFSDGQYLVAKEKFFHASVRNTTIISSYEN